MFESAKLILSKQRKSRYTMLHSSCSPAILAILLPKLLPMLSSLYMAVLGSSRLRRVLCGSILGLSILADEPTRLG